MKGTALVVLVIAGLVAATGIASARMGGYSAQQDSDWFNQMYQWMGQHMGRFGPMMGYYSTGDGNAWGSCPGYGAGYSQESEPLTREEATALLETEIEGDLTSEVYQMGRWYVVFYEDSDSTIKQARADIFTGEVYTDFTPYMSAVNSPRGYGGMGGMMWGY